MGSETGDSGKCRVTSRHAYQRPPRTRQAWTVAALVITAVSLAASGLLGYVVARPWLPDDSPASPSSVTQPLVPASIDLRAPGRAERGLVRIPPADTGSGLP